MSTKTTSPPPSRAPASVVPLNDEAALYLTLVDGIAGAAIGMSLPGQALLRRGLVEKFGHIFVNRGNDAVDELIRLATDSQAA